MENLSVSSYALYHKNLGKSIKSKHRLLLGALIMMYDLEADKVIIKYNNSPFKFLWNRSAHHEMIRHLINHNILEDLTKPDDAVGYYTFRIKEPRYWCNSTLEVKEKSLTEEFKKEVSLLYSDDQKAERNKRLLDRRMDTIREIVAEINQMPQFKIMTHWDFEEKNKMILRRLFVAGVLDSCPPAAELAIKIMRGEMVDESTLQRMVNFATRENNIILTDQEAEKMAINRLQQLGLTLDEAHEKLKQEKHGLGSDLITPTFSRIRKINEAPKTNKKKPKLKRNPYDTGDGGLF